MTKITTLADDAGIAFETLLSSVSDLWSPSLRLGVTGLSRAGKTVFITALVHNLVHGGRLPLFGAYANQRLTGAKLEPQPDDGVPRFDYESHLHDLVEERIWPQSTRSISELRLTIDYESASAWSRRFGPGRLSIDLVDYPGEWLLDLPLLGKSYAEWSAEALDLAVQPARLSLSDAWRGQVEKIDATAEQDESVARDLASTFTDYLRACRADNTALSTLPPGRFLLPGDLEGSPALTFAPLKIENGQSAAKDSFHAMMERRFESYKSIVVKPFFRDHFARIDRQIVLVDALQALNAGPGAVADLKTALADILKCFRPGGASWLTSWFSSRTDKILFAATKADHLHHSDHDRLESLLRELVREAVEHAQFNDASVDVAALAAVRATREGTVQHDGSELPVILGVPMKGERIAETKFDGKTESAVFPGDLPKNTGSMIEGPTNGSSNLNFVRFRPPALEETDDGVSLSLPHIRLDRALEFLIGDRLA
ncbi:MAG: YcjX family protein [Pseudomonadota bacterium]